MSPNTTLRGHTAFFYTSKVSELINRSSHTTPFPFVILTSHVCRRPEMKVSADLSTTTDTTLPLNDRSISNKGGGVAEAKVEPALHRDTEIERKPELPHIQH